MTLVTSHIYRLISFNAALLAVKQPFLGGRPTVSWLELVMAPLQAVGGVE